MQPHRIGVDHAGYIRKHISPAYIQPPYTAVVSFIVAYLRACCAPYLHSIYLAGSIPAGKALVGQSDIDITLVFVDNPPACLQQQRIAELRQQLLATYTFLPKVDIVTGLYAEVVAPEHRYGWGFWFQHCCVCVDGEDVGQSIEPFRPSWQLVAGLNGDIAEYNRRVKGELAAAPDENSSIVLCRSVSRKYIRSAFCLVAVLEESYVDDLDVCVKLFLLHYPMQRKQMQSLLEYARQPTANATAMVHIIDTFGAWLEDRYAALPEGDR
jgi:uncharacterized protein